LRNEQFDSVPQISAADERIAALEKELGVARTAFAAEEEHRQTAEAARAQAIVEEGKAVEQLNEVRLALATEQQRHDNLVAQRQPMTAARNGAGRNDRGAPR